jgi:hypothetical protein
MKIRIVLIAALQLLIVGAMAQNTRQPASLTVTPTTLPEVLQVLDKTGQWTTIGGFRLDKDFIPSGGGQIDVRTYGMTGIIDGVNFDPVANDNSPFLAAVLQANGPAVTLPGIFSGSIKTVFSPIAGQGVNGTSYRFSRAVDWSRASRLTCNSTGTSQFGAMLVFDAGVDGIIEDGGQFSSDATYAQEMDLDGCAVMSLGYGTAQITQGSNQVTSVAMLGNGPIPATTWEVGDGIVPIGFLYGIGLPVTWDSSGSNNAVTISGTTLTTTGTMVGAVCLDSDVVGYGVPPGIKITGLPNAGINRSNTNGTNACTVANGSFTINQPVTLSVPQNIFFLQPVISTNAGATVTNVSGTTLTLDQNVLIPHAKANLSNSTTIKHAIYRLPKELQYTYSTQGPVAITASAAWATTDAQISVSSCAGVFYNQRVLDVAKPGSAGVLTAGVYQSPSNGVGVVSYCDLNTNILYLQAKALTASVGSGDALWIGGSNIGHVVAGPQCSPGSGMTAPNCGVLLQPSDPLWGDAWRFGWVVSSSWNIISAHVTALALTESPPRITVDIPCSPALAKSGVANVRDETLNAVVSQGLTSKALAYCAANGAGSDLYLYLPTKAPLAVGDTLSVPVQSNLAIINNIMTLDQASASQTFTVAALNAYPLPYGFGASVSHNGNGKIWRIPTAVNRRTAATAHHNRLERFPVLLKNLPSTGSFPPSAGATTTWDAENSYELALLGRWFGGNNSGASTSGPNLFGKNFIADTLDVGTVVSTSLGDNMNAMENGEASRSVLGCVDSYFANYIANSIYTSCTLSGFGSLDQTVMPVQTNLPKGDFHSQQSGVPPDANRGTSTSANPNFNVFGVDPCYLGATADTLGGGVTVTISATQVDCAIFVGAVVNDLTSPSAFPVIAPNTTIASYTAKGSFTLSNPVGIGLFQGQTTTGSNQLTVCGKGVCTPTQPLPWGKMCVGDLLKGSGMDTGTTVAALSTGNTTPGACEPILATGAAEPPAVAYQTDTPQIISDVTAVIDTNTGAAFSATFSATSMTVVASPAPTGTICVGDGVNDVGSVVAAGTNITALSNGDTTVGDCEPVIATGGVYPAAAPYTLSVAQTVGVGPIQIVDAAQGIKSGDTLAESHGIGWSRGAPCVEIHGGMSGQAFWNAGLEFSKGCNNPDFIQLGYNAFHNVWAFATGAFATVTPPSVNIMEFPWIGWPGLVEASGHPLFGGGFTLGDAASGHVGVAGYERVIFGSTATPVVTNHHVGDVAYTLNPVSGGTSKLVMTSSFGTTLAGTVTKGTTTSVPVAACPSPALPNSTLINDTTTFPPVELGLLSTCTGTTLTFTAAAINSGANGDQIRFPQWRPAGLISNDTSGNTYTLGVPVVFASLPGCTTVVPAGAQATITDGAQTPGYLTAASHNATGYSRPVICDNSGSWLYH